MPEAIAHLYKSEEGSPLNAIILGLGAGSLEISVFKLGNLVGTTEFQEVFRLIEDVTEGLSRFEGATPLPRVLLFMTEKRGNLKRQRKLYCKLPGMG